MSSFEIIENLIKECDYLLSDDILDLSKISKIKRNLQKVINELENI